MIELALIAAVLGATIGLTLLVRAGSKAAARDEVIVDAQAEAIKDLQERNEIERNTPVVGAADKLRDEWSRD